MRALKVSVELNYRKKLTPNHVTWSWVARHAACLNNRYGIRRDGQTALFVGFGHSYIGKIVPFGEAVLFKAPASRSRQRKRGRRFHN